MANLSGPLRALLGWMQGPRSFLALGLICVGAALLLTDFRGAPGDPLLPGDVALRDIVSPISFSFVDDAATVEEQDAAAAAVLPVYVSDLALAKRLENRISQAFDMARRRWSVLRASEAGRSRRGGRELTEPEVEIQRDFIAALDASVAPRDLEAIAVAGYPEETEDIAIELVGVALRRNVIEDRTNLPSPPRRITVVQTLGEDHDEVVLEDYAQIRTPEEARQAVSLYVIERFGGARDPARVNAAAAIARAVIRPNFTSDPQTTALRQQAAREAVRPLSLEVRRGTRLVRAGDVVSPQQAQMLAGLGEAYGHAGGGAMFAAWFAFAAIIIVTAVAFARGTIRKFASRTRDLEAMGIALLLVLGIARVLATTVNSFIGPGDYDLTTVALLVPVAGGAMTVRILVNSESALVWGLVAAVLTASMMDQSALLGAYYIVSALAAAGGAGQARERFAVLRSGALAGLLGAGMVLLMVLIRTQNPASEAALPDLAGVLRLVFAAVVGGILSAFVALGSIPAFELIGFTTDYKLLELSNLNHPLLRQLMLRAPGTYHHSVIVGSLSEAACEAIGANALLARVACYFHDIGKGLKPQYFIENQREAGNRHDRLSPMQSAQLIINHVREGGVLAMQYRLPRPIADQIYMHHGTGILQHFFNKAREQAGPGEAPDESLFRYPGPKPDSREAGIIMLADKVEAACRTIREPGEARIRAMIQQIINSVMGDGQFDNCPLTLKELYTIADTFTAVLLGIYHHRIEYPATAAISSGKGRLAPVPKQGTITLEIMNPLRPPPPGSGSGVGATVNVGAPGEGSTGTPPAVDYEAADLLPGGRTSTSPIIDDS